MTEKVQNFITRTITGILFVAIIVTCFLRPFAMVFLFALVTGMTIWEFCGLVNNIKSVQTNRFICTIAGVYFFLAVAGFCSGMTPSAVFIPYLLTVVYLFVSELYTKAENPINNWAYTMLSQMYIALPFSMLNVLAFQNAPGQDYPVYSWLLPLSVFIFLWMNDTGAYCSGMLFGKHKLFPRISPAKSWEGSIISTLLPTVPVERKTGAPCSVCPNGSAWDLSSLFSVRWATWSKASSSAHWASRIQAISCRDTEACSTDSTRHSWRFLLPWSISTPLRYCNI